MNRPASAAPAFMRSAAVWIAAAILLIIAPLLFSSASSITIMNQMAITIVFALAYNMLLGQGGMLSFGHAVYMGLGGFFVMHLLNYLDTWDIHLPLPLLPIFGGLFGMGIAMIIGSFSTRNAGTVFAMISLGVGELVAACSIIITAFFGGEEGVTGDRTWNTSFFGIEWLTQIEVYYLIAFWTFIAALGMYLFSRTPLGRMANAVRDNPERAEFLGYSARWVRYGSFVASGFFAGIAGALFGINFEILTEENLNAVQSGSVLLIAFLGGIGFFAGPIIGAIVFTLLQTVMSLYTEIWALYLGALFVAVVMFAPQGLTGIIAMHAIPWKLGRIGTLAVPYVTTVLPGVVAALAGCALVEMLFHVRHASPGDHAMHLYFIEVDSHSPIPWLISAAIMAIGIYFVRRGGPELVHVWHEANKLPETKLGGQK